MKRLLPLVALTALMSGACVARADAQMDHAAMDHSKMQHMDHAMAQQSVTAPVIGLDGKSIGTLTLTQVPTGVLLALDVSGLPAGDHGFHFHETGTCDAAAKFASAGGHFAAGMKNHGLMMADGPHGGDMPNQHVGADGRLVTQVLNTGVTLSAGPKSLLDADGSALVIHAGKDDYMTQPTGDAGGRIACAVIKGA